MQTKLGIIAAALSVVLFPEKGGSQGTSRALKGLPLAGAGTTHSFTADGYYHDLGPTVALLEKDA